MSDFVLMNDSVRLRAEFKTFDDEYADPENITLKIFDKNKNQIGSTINITAENKISTGIYIYDYLVPDGYSYLVYEYSGVLEGTKVTGREAISVKWV